MYQYVFIHDDERAYVIKAKNQRNAVKAFMKKVDGRFGFFRNLKLHQVLEDIAMGSITLWRATRAK